MNGSKYKRDSFAKQKCYINGSENLSVLDMYFIEAFIILLFLQRCRFGFHYVFKMSWKAKNCCGEDVSKTSWRRFEETWRQTKCLLRISVSNKSKLASSNSIFHKCISDESKRIQNALIRTQ